MCFKKYPEQWPWIQYHSYIENCYEQEFAKFQNKKNIKVCEIGVDVGGSIALWSKYFEKGTIVGIDNNPARLDEQYKAENLKNVQYHFTDAYDKDFIKTLPSFDIIIDDGPHSLPSMLSFIKYYFHKLKAGGVMIIEDIPMIEWINHFELLVPEKATSKTIDLREIDNRHDSLIFIIQK